MKLTKKISNGVYFHLTTEKYVSAFVGCSSTVWNIFNDEDLCDEFAIGFHTKKEAVEYLNGLK
jgi:hypothetical protein